MTYIVNGSEVSLPLTVEAIENHINDVKTNQPDYYLMNSNAVQIDLYRDVLIAIRGGASHSRELAEAALKLEE